MNETKYQSEFTEARMNLLPAQYTRCRIWYDEENEKGDIDSYEPPLILNSKGNGKNRMWTDNYGNSYNNKELVKLIREEINDWQYMSPNHYLTVDFTSKDGEYMDYIEDIFTKGTITFDRFPNYREHPNTYKGKRVTSPKKHPSGCMCHLQNSVRKMF